MMQRREFVTLLGSAAAWPITAHAQQSGRMRHIGVLMPLPADHPVTKARIGAFLQALHQLGWIEGRNLRIDYRWSVGDAEQLNRDAAELVALAPEVILATGSPPVAALQRATRTVPIVFVLVSDPVGAGFVASQAQPGGNTTGFTPFEYGMSAKLLEVLKEIAPRLTRVLVMGDPSNVGAVGQMTAIHVAAKSLDVEVIPFDGHEAGTTKDAITAFVRSPNGGLVVPAIPPATFSTASVMSG